MLNIGEFVKNPGASLNFNNLPLSIQVSLTKSRTRSLGKRERKLVPIPFGY